MLKRLWHALSFAALAIVVAGIPRTTGIAAGGASSIAGVPPRETALQLPGVEPGTKVVAAALADIDADGDLDLIATDGTLDLLVWSNDGSGHFTRKYPGHAPADGWFSRDGRLDPGTGTTPASVIPSGSASLIDPARASRALDAREWRIGSAASSLVSRALLRRASRAPPLSLRSA